MNFNFTSFFMMVDFLEQVKASHQVFSGMLFFAVLEGVAVSEESSGTEHRKTPKGSLRLSAARQVLPARDPTLSNEVSVRQC
jgi:hypothetical protein